MVRQLAASLVGALALSAVLGNATHVQAQAQEGSCEPVHVTGYAPVVTNCGVQTIQRYPLPPVYEGGRWVIEDEGQQFTLVKNIHREDYAAKDSAMKFFESTHIQIRFGLPHAFDVSEVSEDILKEYVGIYVASDSIGEWVVFGLPLADASQVPAPVRLESPF